MWRRTLGRLAPKAAAASEAAAQKKASSATEGGEKKNTTSEDKKKKGSEPFDKNKTSKPEMRKDKWGNPGTCVEDWRKEVRAKTPVILEPGKASPKSVISFGGCGFLVTYQLGVAKFLQQEKKSQLNKSFLLGAGSGVIPAMALAAGPEKCDVEKVLEFIIEDFFDVQNEQKRRDRIREGTEKFFPDDIHKILSGRLALAISFSNRDPGYMKQGKEELYFGHHISVFDNKKDVEDLIVAAMCPNANMPCEFREADNVVRGTQFTMSSELDQYCRHVHIHGYSGNGKNRHQNRHNYFFGRHGLLVNTHCHFVKQAWMAFMPTKASKKSMQDLHRDAFENGFHDARRYERWEEDPYHFAKPDRSTADDFNWKAIRASLIGRKPGERFEL